MIMGLRWGSVSTFVCAGSLYTGNELEKCLYCIVPSKRPWALAAEVPKIEGGRLHGEGA